MSDAIQRLKAWRKERRSEHTEELLLSSKDGEIIADHVIELERQIYRMQARFQDIFHRATCAPNDDEQLADQELKRIMDYALDGLRCSGAELKASQEASV